ncbi:MAG: PHP domain-containing protein, partial [Candidatus Nezhaarchaeales archaeon]
MARLDLHVHSVYSVDARLRPEDIIKEALKRGLDGVAVTDHGTVKGGLAVRRLSPPGFIAIPGVEAKTSRGELLILFIEEEVRSRDPLEVIDEAREAGGLVVLPHPFDWMRGSKLEGLEELVEKVDAIEVFNSRCPLLRLNIRAQRLAKSLNKPSTAGSDAHFSMEVGKAWTVVEANSA